MGTSMSVDRLLFSSGLPYSAEVMVVPLPMKFRVPSMEIYDIAWFAREGGLQSLPTNLEGTNEGVVLFPSTQLYRQFYQNSLPISHAVHGKQKKKAPRDIPPHHQVRREREPENIPDQVQ